LFLFLWGVIFGVGLTAKKNKIQVQDNLEGIEATTRIIIIIIIIIIINWEIRDTKLPRFNPNHSKEKSDFVSLLKSQVT
jgi:hypothetical protein